MVSGKTIHKAFIIHKTLFKQNPQEISGFHVAGRVIKQNGTRLDILDSTVNLA